MQVVCAFVVPKTSFLASRSIIEMNCNKNGCFLVLDLSEDVRERWDNFVANQLADMNKKNTVELVRIQISSFFYPVLLSCQPRVTVTSCFVYKVFRDLKLIDHLCINPIRR